MGKYILESHCFEESCFSRCIRRSAGGKLYTAQVWTFLQASQQHLILRWIHCFKLSLQIAQRVLLFCPKLINANYFFFLLLWISSCPSCCTKSIYRWLFSTRIKWQNWKRLNNFWTFQHGVFIATICWHHNWHTHTSSITDRWQKKSCTNSQTDDWIVKECLLESFRLSMVPQMLKKKTGSSSSTTTSHSGMTEL